MCEALRGLGHQVWIVSDSRALFLYGGITTEGAAQGWRAKLCSDCGCWRQGCHYQVQEADGQAKNLEARLFGRGLKTLMRMQCYAVDVVA